MHTHGLRITIGIAAFALASSSASLAATAVRSNGFSHLNGPQSGMTSMRTDARTAKQLLYIGDNANSKVYVYKLKGKTTPKQIATITSGLNGPQGLTTDLSGNLYVTNLYGNTVTMYKPGSLVPSLTLSNSIQEPTDVKVDGFGNIYVSNSPGFGAAGYILEFPAGSTAPSFIWYTPQINTTISGITLLNPTQQGEVSVYAAAYTINGSGYASGSVLSCYPGNGACATVSNSFGQTGGITVAQSPGNQSFQWLVTDLYVPGVDTYTNQQRSGQLVTGGTPQFIALNANKTDLFVSDSFENRVTEYAWPSGTVVNHIDFGGGAAIYGVAVSPAGTYF